MTQSEDALIEQEVEAELEEQHRVTNLELFFDLVFVFALTQVTAFLADDLTWGGLLRGLFVLAALGVPAVLAHLRRREPTPAGLASLRQRIDRPPADDR